VEIFCVATLAVLCGFWLRARAGNAPAERLAQYRRSASILLGLSLLTAARLAILT
jgi:hypothetical protein